MNNDVNLDPVLIKSSSAPEIYKATLPNSSQGMFQKAMIKFNIENAENIVLDSFNANAQTHRPNTTANFVRTKKQERFIRTSHNKRRYKRQGLNSLVRIYLILILLIIGPSIRYVKAVNY